MRAFASATFGLHLALRLLEKTNNDVTPTSTVLNPLMHVRPPRAGGIACSERPVQLRHRSSVREGEGIVVIKFLGLVRVDATHQSTGLDISLLHIKMGYFVCRSRHILLCM